MIAAAVAPEGIRWALPADRTSFEPSARNNYSPLSYGRTGGVQEQRQTFSQTNGRAETFAQTTPAYSPDVRWCRPRSAPARPVYNRVTAPSYVRSTPGYAGYKPGQRFLAGGQTYGHEMRTLARHGTPSQPLYPNDVPIRYDNQQYHHQTPVPMPGYQGFVEGQRDTTGNFRVENFKTQFKPEIRRGSMFTYPPY